MIDVQAALAHALANAQMAQPSQATPMPHHAQVSQMQQIAQALAKQIANQRQAPGKARPYGRTDVGGQMLNPHYQQPPVDGGYSGAGIHGPNGQLIARAGFGPHPVLPTVLPEGFFPPPRVPGVNYVQ